MPSESPKCGICGQAMEPGQVAAFGPIHWFSGDPSLAERLLGGGDVLPGINFTGNRLRAWRCDPCKKILIDFQA